jgi:excisionase family DNA binding protein
MNTVAAQQHLPQAKDNSKSGSESAITSESREGYGPGRNWSPGRRHPDLLDWDEAAAMLGCSRTTLKRIKRAGKIGCTPIGSGSRPRIWFTRKDVEDYLEAQRQPRLDVQRQPRRDAESDEESGEESGEES